MAQFPNLSTEMTFRGKTHTNLVISEGMAPAEDMIISRTNDAPTFPYEYGPEGNQTVVLAKGKIVEVVGEEYDSETGYKKTAVREAKDGSEKAIGVNLHNVYARRRDGMHSHLTKPTVITRNYIEVPLFETDGGLENAQELAEAMRFGAAVSDIDSEDTTLKHGDKVVSDRRGNFRKYVKGTDAPEAIVGTVWAKETNLPPAGFLQYYQEMVNPEMEAWINQMSRVPSPGIPAKGADAYPYGVPYQHKGWLPSYEEMLGNKGVKGIPFLTDGFFRAQETLPIEVKKDNEKFIEAVRTSHKDEVVYEENAGTLTVQPGLKNAAIFIKLRNKLDITQLENVAVTLDGDRVNANDLHIDVKNNTIVVYLEEQASEKVYNNIIITAPSIVSAVAGLPTEWDYKGTVGAVRILLQK